MTKEQEINERVAGKGYKSATGLMLKVNALVDMTAHSKIMRGLRDDAAQDDFVFSSAAVYAIIGKVVAAPEGHKDVRSFSSGWRKGILNVVSMMRESGCSLSGDWAWLDSLGPINDENLQDAQTLLVKSAQFFERLGLEATRRLEAVDPDGAKEFMESVDAEDLSLASKVITEWADKLEIRD